MQNSEEISHYEENNCVITEKNVVYPSKNSIVVNGNSNGVLLQQNTTNSVKKVDSKNRVKFLVDQDFEIIETKNASEFESAAFASSEMNHNLTSSQPLVLNGHLGNVNVNSDLAESQKLANSHPHVTISSHQHHPKDEDRTFGTKIDNSYQGWDNPFRPEGELSHDAEDIVKLWKEGKRDFSLLLKAKEDENNEMDPDETDSLNQTSLTDCKEPLLNSTHTQQNGKSAKNGTMSNNKNGLDIKTSTMAPPSKPEKANLIGGDEPKKKQGCCSLM